MNYMTMKTVGNMMYRLVATLAVVTVCCGAWAQSSAISLPYFNGFEDSEENSRWTLNSGEPCNDKWYIGTSMQREGDSAMYISASGIDSIVCGQEKNVVMAYRKISYPSGRSCQITFDWLNLVEYSGSGLYVSIYDASLGEPLSEAGTLDPSPFVSLGRQSALLQGDGNWDTESFPFVFRAGTEYYMVFVWVNNEQECKTIPPPEFSPPGTLPTIVCAKHFGAVVDNIQIADNQPKAPTDIDVVGTCDTALVSWQAPASLFDFSYRQSGTESDWITVENWKGASGSSRHTYRIEGISEGVYDFRIRSIATVGTDTLYSAYSYRYAGLVFCAANHCFNYIDLHDTSLVRCYGGSSSDGRGLFEMEAVDNGYRSVYSRHTIHYLQDEIDTRTMGGTHPVGLKTVPPGELASVRVGNWLGTQMDGIEYTLPVTQGMEVLLLKYAVVLQDPLDDHSLEERPYFGLELYDKEGNIISEDCGVVHFYSDITKPNWHQVPNAQGVVVWNDWTTVGFNLKSYVGDTVKVRVVVKDCFFTVHYGYGYFTLGCTSADIKGVSCGAGTSMDLKAPDGFDYAWFAADDTEHKDTLYKESVYTVYDTREYECVMLFRDPEKQGCGFSAKTKAEPRIPFATYDYEHVPDTCHNYVRFTNRSHVLTRDENGNEVPNGETADDILWTINGIEYDRPEVTVEVLPEGGSVTIEMTASIEGGCSDDTAFVYTVPSILSPTRTIDTTLCYGDNLAWCEPIQIDGIMNDTVFICELTNCYGCDSTTIINVHCNPRSPRTVIDTTICFGTSFTDWHTPLTTDGTYRDTFPNRYGCDSIVVVNLTVASEVLFDITTKDVMSQPHSGEIGIIPDASLPEFTYTINDEPGGALTGLDAGRYHITVFDSLGCSRDTVVELFAEYLSVSVSDGIYACSGDDSIAIPYTVLKGYSPAYHITFDTVGYNAGFAKVDSSALLPDHITLPLPSLCRPNHYTAYITFYDIMGRDQMLPVLFTVRYDSTVISQKWNDVLAVTNHNHNGGYRFTAYQWYRDGDAIPGATRSYYYSGDDRWLDTASLYHVALTRVEDGEVIPTCPVQAVRRSDITLMPTLMQTRTTPSSLIEVRNAPSHATVRIYDLRGILWDEQSLLDGTILTPSERGAYIVVIITPEYRYTEKIMIY